MVYKTVYPAGNYILRINYRNAGLIGGVCCKVSNQGSKTVSVESSVFAFNFQHMPWYAGNGQLGDIGIRALHRKIIALSLT